ncbi:hypothetical protein GIB67_026362, partial [Kingdonia uniflora]
LEHLIKYLPHLVLRCHIGFLPSNSTSLTWFSSSKSKVEPCFLRLKNNQPQNNTWTNSPNFLFSNFVGPFPLYNIYFLKNQLRYCWMKLDLTHLV